MRLHDDYAERSSDRASQSQLQLESFFHYQHKLFSLLTGLPSSFTLNHHVSLLRQHSVPPCLSGPLPSDARKGEAAVDRKALLEALIDYPQAPPPEQLGPLPPVPT